MELFAVAIGGACGALARYGLSGVVQQRFEGSFPAGTLAVNLLGCFLIGILMTLVKERQLFAPETRMLLTIGFLGSLTTFSTFGYETLELMRTGETRLALLSVTANVVLGLAGVWLGRAAVKLL